MLSYRTIAPHTLELLKHLMAAPALQDCRLVGGRTRMSLTYFEDAEGQECPKMWMNADWKTVKESIIEAVREVDWSQIAET